jgi:hypothetical protein
MFNIVPHLNTLFHSIMLKKFFFAAAFTLVTGFAASAQDVTTTSGDGGIKPTAGEITGEVQLSLTGGSTISLNQLRGRYFLSPTTALRASFTLDSDTETNDDRIRKSTYVVVAPGIEKHFAGTERLSPYVGAELQLSKLFASYESDALEIDGAWNVGSNGSDFVNGRNYFGIGLGLVAGADYYFAKHVYLGVEFGYGLTYRTYGDVEVRETNGPDYTIDRDESYFSLGSSVNSGLRLGFVF